MDNMYYLRHILSKNCAKYRPNWTWIFIDCFHCQCLDMDFTAHTLSRIKFRDTDPILKYSITIDYTPLCPTEQERLPEVNISFVLSKVYETLTLHRQSHFFCPQVHYRVPYQWIKVVFLVSLFLLSFESESEERLPWYLLITCGPVSKACCFN